MLIMLSMLLNTVALILLTVISENYCLESVEYSMTTH